MRAWQTIVGTLTLVAASAGVAPAQSASLQLKITDTAGVVLPLANVETSDKARFVADQMGMVRLTATVGTTVQMSVFRLGFAPQKLSVTLAGDSTVDVRMIPLAIRLSEKVIIAKRYDGLTRAGFYDRLNQRERGAGSGTFLTPEDLAERNAVCISHVLDRAPGVKLSHTPGGHMIPRSTAGNCNMEIYLDGARLITEATRPGVGTSTPSLQPRSDANRRSARLEYLDEIVQASSVAGVEIYTHGASVPQQFQSLNGTCGVIVIWTRTG